MKLSNNQKKLLKLLSKQKIVFIDAINPIYLSTIDYLSEKNLIKKKTFTTSEVNGSTLSVDSADLYIMLTQDGEAVADNLLSSKLEKLNTMIPLLAFILSMVTLILSILGII